MIKKGNIRVMITLPNELVNFINLKCKTLKVSKSKYIKSLLLNDKEKHQ